MPPFAATSALVIASGVQMLLCLIGLFVLWGYWSGRARPPALARWDVRGTDFTLAGLLTICSGFGLQTVLVETLGDKNDTLWELLVPGGGFQIGVLVGAFAAWKLYLRKPVAPESAPAGSPRLSTPVRRPMLEGGRVFAAILPVTIGASYLWLHGLEFLGIDAPKQDLIDLFAKTDRPGPFIALTFVAVVLAPLTEEIVFRGGFFRFCRGRLPRPIALMLPAAVFAALHNNLGSFLPLMVLGVLFAIAYESSGKIVVPIVAHALFNLNTILLVLCGVAQ